VGAQDITEWVRTLTLTTALVVAITAIVRGFVVTKGHHEEVVRLMEQKCVALQKELDKDDEEIRATTETMARMVAAVQGNGATMGNVVEAVRGMQAVLEARQRR
jgi:hypothetical protein